MFGRLLLFVCWSAVVFAQSGATIEGRVVSLSGNPVRRAMVQLRNVGGVDPAAFSAGTVQVANARLPFITVETDGEGRFSTQGMQPGTVQAVVTRTGYETATQSIPITAGQSSVSATIPMTRLSTIYGKVSDEYGDPFARANIAIFRRVYENGWRLQQMTLTSAGPDGNYAVGDLAVGRYYVAAADTSSGTIQGQTTRYLQTYYPGAIEPSGATPIDITPEAELRGIDIRLQRGKVFRISGKVSMIEGLQSSTVSLVPRDSNVGMVNRPIGTINPKDGSFVVERVPEGAYYAQVQMTLRAATGPTPLTGATTNTVAANNVVMTTVSGREPVTVSGRDVDNVVIRLYPGAEITGHVRTEGTLPPATGNVPAARGSVILRSVDSNAGGPTLTTQVTADGVITVKNVPPGMFLVTASGPPGTYKSSIRYDGQDVTWTPITVGSSGGALEVLFKTDGARLTGVARNDKGDPLAESRVTIWAASAKGYVGTATTDATGTFRFQSLPPGDYRVAAWDRKLTSTPVYSNVTTAPEFLHQFDTAASTIRLEPSGQQTQDAKMIPQSAVEAALARLP